ncbi:hypothetical protein AVEN_180616-1, partial [Araneus ventricosus]
EEDMLTHFDDVPHCTPFSNFILKLSSGTIQPPPSVCGTVGCLAEW